MEFVGEFLVQLISSSNKRLRKPHLASLAKQAVEEITSMAYPMIDGLRPFRDCELAFAHPKKMNGVLLEIIDYKWRELEGGGAPVPPARWQFSRL